MLGKFKGKRGSPSPQSGSSMMSNLKEAHSLLKKNETKATTKVVSPNIRMKKNGGSVKSKKK